MLHLIEKAAKDIGLQINQTKTEYMAYNQNGKIETTDGYTIKEVEDFVYLGSHLKSSQKDIETRIQKAMAVLNKLGVIWKSNLSKSLKLCFFRATVEAVLLYGINTWTLTKTFANRLDGCYTKLLRVIHGVSWRDNINSMTLYAGLPPITTTIMERRLRFIGHCQRSDTKLVSKVLLWTPTQGKRKRGRPSRNYIQQLEEDIQLKPEEAKAAMLDRDTWRELVKSRVSSTR